MSKVIPLERKIRIVERMLNGDSQKKVSNSFGISTGEASNIWNDFLNGRIVPGDAGMLSEELLGIARILREGKMNPGEAANLIALGKILRDSGVDANVLSNVSMQLKGYDEAEMKHIFKNLLEIQKVKGQGESILDAES